MRRPPYSQFVITVPTGASAHTIYAASASQADVQDAIDAASDGDTVIVPAGTATWTTLAAYTPSVTINKAITVQGATTCAGSGATLTYDDQTIITVGCNTNFDEIPFYLSVSGARLTGFTIHDTRVSGGSSAYIKTNKGTANCRVDHIHIKPASNATAHGMELRGFGLVDHCYIEQVNTAIYAWGEMAGDTYPGDGMWLESLSPGSANAVYVEDNKIVYTTVRNGIDNYSGAKVVYRYNDVTGTNIGSHGLDSGGLRSVVLMEVYGNTFAQPGTATSQWFVSRGGQFLVWGNTISASGGSFDRFLDIRNYRSDSSYSSSWGPADGTNPLDQNTPGQEGWVCKDQVGWFQGAWNPSYSWANSWKGSSPTWANSFAGAYENHTRAQTYHLLNNREFFVEVASFDGTAGTGSGLLSNRPATCTAGVGYWATDTQTFYKATATNTWTAYYTPYTYPHPLQG